jgi:tetratricopeptide (TPR) repeat protein
MRIPKLWKSSIKVIMPITIGAMPIASSRTTRLRSQIIPIQLNPQNTFAYLYRGVAYQADGQSELAIADYTALIKMDDQNAAAYAKRGEAYLSLKQKEAGIADLRQASDIYKKLKEPEKAERIQSQLRSLK